MQFTTLTALFATALAVSATPLQQDDTKRQEGGVPRVYARFYNDGGCGPSPWAEDTVFIQSETVGLAGCQDLTVGPFASTFFDTNNFSRTGELYIYKVIGEELEMLTEIYSSLLQPSLLPTYFYDEWKLY